MVQITCPHCRVGSAQVAPKQHQRVHCPGCRQVFYYRPEMSFASTEKATEIGEYALADVRTGQSRIGSARPQDRPPPVSRARSTHLSDRLRTALGLSLLFSAAIASLSFGIWSIRPRRPSVVVMKNAAATQNPAAIAAGKPTQPAMIPPPHPITAPATDPPSPAMDANRRWKAVDLRHLLPALDRLSTAKRREAFSRRFDAEIRHEVTKRVSRLDRTQQGHARRKISTRWREQLIDQAVDSVMIEYWYIFGDFLRGFVSKEDDVKNEAQLEETFQVLLTFPDYTARKQDRIRALINRAVVQLLEAS